MTSCVSRGNSRRDFSGLSPLENAASLQKRWKRFLSTRARRIDSNRLGMCRPKRSNGLSFLCGRFIARYSARNRDSSRVRHSPRRSRHESFVADATGVLS